ncbi:glycoside hydrolase family 3 C-terminal domain-containing protein [uncultured Thomasclavelia sp.]|uniref:glycoside hydrolase family 3 C-terminal domain-containing protein n=1 Tax=uncultured Thomasclavelia sp. TaxID=3025759 RepID=UPI002592FDC1|nr:glycoside hydrolase family 3 C-terminal domain-containing protein [uncultured Thomasclavelia sp.]
MKKTYKRVLATSMSAALAMTSMVPAFAKTTDGSISAREEKNAELSMNLATQGMVLLENNNNVLPMASSGNVALFGGGAAKTVKGGTGSGDVNQRSVTTVWDGFKNAGYTITSESWLKEFSDYYDKETGGSSGGLWGSPKVEDTLISDAQIEEAKQGGTTTAVYVIARNSGEFTDRLNAEGDYQLWSNEEENLKKVAANFDNVIVVLNVGGIIDTKFFHEIEGLDSLLLMSQAGMRGGDAVVKVLNGEVTPSGKLTDTWAVNYEDYSSSEGFGANDENVTQEEYTDDIYVGYRYFDTFNVTPAYEFGYGLSYTDFNIDVKDVTVDEENVTVDVRVTNVGEKYAGKEVVEVYFSAPDGALEKPYQELATYGKTDTLAPGESQELTLSYATTEMSSYSQDLAAYVMENGDYVVRVGNSSRNTSVEAVINLDSNKVTEQLSNQMVQDEAIETLSNEGATPYTYEGEAEEIAKAERFELDANAIKVENNASEYDDESVISYVYEGSDYTVVDQEANPRYTKAPSGNNTTPSQLIEPYEETIQVVEKTKENPTLLDVYQGTVTMEELLASLSIEEMSYIVEGLGWGGGSEPIVGAQANSVKGAAGETTSRYYESRKIPNTVLADGPAGIRITQSYKENDTTYYQYCTAFPIGTLIAQSWDKDVAKQFGEAIGEEMLEMGVTMWLAPGMNIHRNPLCGRNFEYYSEDPLVAGVTAASTTLGVQSNEGIGVTIKHYAGNNQENNRNAVNNTITERALREIYLKGFEIAVKTANPMAIMTSYNLNNSMPAADDYDLCTDIPRGEWGFNGLIMTDWGGGQSTPVNSMHAGNDLIMPGGSSKSIAKATGVTLPLGDLQKATRNVLNVIMDSTQFKKIGAENGVEVEIGKFTESAGLGLFLAATKSEVTSVNKTALQIAVDVASNITEEELENVVPAVANELKAALEEAKAILENATADQETVDASFDRLATAIQMLDFIKGDKAALRSFIAKVENIVEKEYTPATWTAFAAALETGNKVLANENAMQEEVDNAYTNLVKAYLNLRLVPNKDKLEDLINQTKALVAANYTADTWKNLSDALVLAENVMSNENATSEEVTNAETVLTKAVEGLVVNNTPVTPSTPAVDNTVDSAVKTPVNSGDTTASVKTGDESLTGLFGGITLLSIAGAVLLKRKEN